MKGIYYLQYFTRLIPKTSFYAFTFGSNVWRGGDSRRRHRTHQKKGLLATCFMYARCRCSSFSNPLAVLLVCLVLMWVTFRFVQLIPGEMPEPEKIETWADCEQLMSNSLRLELAPTLYKLLNKFTTWRSNWKIQRTDQKIREEYSELNCSTVLKDKFNVRSPSLEEREFPIAYTIQVYKGAALLERLLPAVYMPHNVHCIHIDKKSSEMFRRAVIKLIKCLPNVFVTRRVEDVIYYHISILRAQLNCMHDLLQSRVKWKYLINLVGQDYPMYDNSGIVQALKSLRGLNNIESAPMPSKQTRRYKYSYKTVRNFGVEHSAYDLHRKGPKNILPPRNITIFKGSTLVAVTRGFCEHVQKDSLTKSFLHWLSDTLIPEEMFYASLQPLNGVLGGYHSNHGYHGHHGYLGYHGNQSDWIMRAIHWNVKGKQIECHGKWVREVCVIDFPDLGWIFGRKNRRKLFLQKISFDFDGRLLDCIDVANKKRRYGSFIYNH